MALFLDEAFDRQKGAMNLSSLSHNQLIRLLANEPYNQAAWKEFTERFDGFLAGVIKRECEKLRHREGLANFGDLLHDVYLKFLKDECEAFRTYRGQHENSIWPFLEIAARRVVLNDWRKLNARKRPPGAKRLRELVPERIADLLDLFPDKDATNELDRLLMEIAIEQCLHAMSKKLRHAARDIRVFHLYLYEGMNAETIAALPEINLSSQSVFRIIADIKERLARCLKESEQ